MSTDIDQEALEGLRNASIQVKDSDYRNDDDEDDFVVAMLYKTADGKHFRYIESSGMNSEFSGAGEFGQWLEADELAGWDSWSN